MNTPGAPLSAAELRRRMSRLRRLFYFSVLLDFVVLGGVGAGLLWLMPSLTGLMLALGLLLPLGLWHQTWLREQMRCPSCEQSLYEWDGIALHARACHHCGAALR